MAQSSLAGNLGGSIAKEDVAADVAAYRKYHATDGGDEAARKGAYADMVNKYYDLSTSFYEYGWGESFHFAHRHKNETLRESIRRHEHYLAMHLRAGPGAKVLDVGCGVGGPAREIATFTGCTVTGLNNNAYQVGRANAITQAAGLGSQLRFVKGDFMKMPFEGSEFDAVYQIEATVHAPDPVGCYSEVLRVLKPGGYFVGYEWCVSDSFDPSDPAHARSKAEIELGNGLPDMLTCSGCVRALEEAGFEVEVRRDLAPDAEVPWWEPLAPSRMDLSLESFRTTLVGRTLTRWMVWAMEGVGVAPKGSVEVSRFLEKGADGLVDGGRMGIFTPMFFFVAKKPLAK